MNKVTVSRSLLVRADPKRVWGFTQDWNRRRARTLHRVSRKLREAGTVSRAPGAGHVVDGNLSQNGLYRYSRNPIYVGMLLTDLGLFMCLPNAATLVILAVGYVSLQLQIRLEEAHLESIHGDAFVRYRTEVRRWL